MLSVVPDKMFILSLFWLLCINTSSPTQAQTGAGNELPKRQDLSEVVWWKKTNFYHIYLRSFKDSNGDGQGDLRGVIEKLDYLQQINVETLLMSPFYSSPMKDGGYDIDDYRAINPMFGTMADFEELVGELKRRSMRIVVDFVPNHSSDQHEWFKCSERALLEPERCGKYKDYYVWSNSTRFEGKYPSNWISVFGGGSAWQWSELRKEFYLHQFMPEQPDLNFENPLVREEFKEIARFWFRKGVDGLRIDALIHIYEDLVNYTDEPVNPDWRPGDDPYDKLLHTHTRSYSNNEALVVDWRQVAEEPEFRAANKVLITEAYDTIPRLMGHYGRSPANRYADLPFNFQLIKLDKRNLNAANVESLALSWIRAARALNWPDDEAGARSPWICWVTGNHDNQRLANKIGLENVQAFKWLTYLLPGVPVDYYGDEIPLKNSNPKLISAKTMAEGESSRLPYRAPVAWTGEQPAAGFSSSADIWLPLNDDYATNNVEHLLSNRSDPPNQLQLFVQLGRLRKQKLGVLVFGDLVFYRTLGSVPAKRNVLAMARTHETLGNLLLLVNFDPEHKAAVHLHASLSEFDAVLKLPPSRGKVVLVSAGAASGPSEPKVGASVALDGLVLDRSQAIIIEF